VSVTDAVANTSGGPAEPYISAGPAATGIALGCLGVLMLGLQPLLLGALLDEHRVSVAQLTQAATMEQLMIGVVAGAMGGLVPRRRLRLIGILACAVLAGANAACLWARGSEVVLDRALCGVGGGALLWIAGSIVAFSQVPARLSGVFVGSQSASQFGLAALLPITLMARYGSNGGFAAIAALGVAGIGLCVLLPSSIPDIVQQHAKRGRVNVPALAGLAASFLFMAAIVGFFVFLEPLAAANRVPTLVAQYAVAENFAAQIIGAGLCVVFAPRLAAAVTGTLSVAALAFLLAIAIVWTEPGSVPFLLAVFIHGLVWTTGLTLFTPLLIRVDPTRRGAMLLLGTLLLGGSAGPLITGWYATESHLAPVLVSAAVLGIGWLLAVQLAAVLGRRGQSRRDDGIAVRSSSTTPK
jgi:MFS transporter, DHA1 family, inner membrane transport protein